MAKKGNKVYAVAAGRIPGIYSSWEECKAQTTGFKGAVFKSFSARYEAESFMQARTPASFTTGTSSKKAPSLPAKTYPKTSSCSSAASNAGSFPSEGKSNEDNAHGVIFHGPGVNDHSKKVYAVASGHKPGVYATWAECQAQTKGYSRAVFKSFKTTDDAVNFVKSHNGQHDAGNIGSSQQNRKRLREMDQDPAQSKKLANQTCELQITIHFDGGSRGNPGVAGAGAEIVINSSASEIDTSGKATTAKSTAIETTYLVRQYCGNNKTNNFAEYTGLLSGLQKAKSFVSEYVTKKTKQCATSSSATSSTKTLFQMNIYGDSNLIIQQLKGVYQCKNTNIRPLFDQCIQLIGELKNMGNGNNDVLYDHVYREQNKVADALANEAMDQRKSWTTSSSRTDFDGDGDIPEKSIPLAASASKIIKDGMPKHEVIDVDDEDSYVSC